MIGASTFGFTFFLPFIHNLFKFSEGSLRKAKLSFFVKKEIRNQHSLFVLRLEKSLPSFFQSFGAKDKVPICIIYCWIPIYNVYRYPGSAATMIGVSGYRLQLIARYRNLCSRCIPISNEKFSISMEIIIISSVMPNDSNLFHKIHKNTKAAGGEF